MKPGVATAPDGGQQPEDEPEQPRPGDTRTPISSRLCRLSSSGGRGQTPSRRRRATTTQRRKRRRRGHSPARTCSSSSS
jgi:hypothetical protein